MTSGQLIEYNGIFIGQQSLEVVNKDMQKLLGFINGYAYNGLRIYSFSGGT